MTPRVFAPPDAIVASLLLLILTGAAMWGALRTERGSGFGVSLRHHTPEQAVQEMPRSANEVSVNLNDAGVTLLSTLPGIGPPLAEAIVRFREVHGPFRHLSDLERVPGIGPKRLARIRPYLIVGDEATWSTR